ncbi:SOS response-associated peptidase [Paenibacillus sp. MMO-58]|uniref:SOS response-associated peptidase n=1 Tax=Paenibacillus sp. MMO-58 TaxID=3081290 RepID=UPI003016F34E
MCGRFTITAELDEIIDTFSVDEVNYEYTKRYNVAPTQTIPCIIERDGKRVLEGFRWGLIPFWANDAKIAYKTINARSEGIEKKPSFRHLLKRNRILIVSDGFFEWKQEAGSKQPYRFQLASKGVYGFAGLFDTWHDPDSGNEIQTSTIITTTPNDLVATVHDRMPVILTGAGAADWINPQIADTERVLSYLNAYPDTEMIKYPVSKDIGNVRNSSADLIKEEVTINSK